MWCSSSRDSPAEKQALQASVWTLYTRLMKTRPRLQPHYFLEQAQQLKHNKPRMLLCLLNRSWTLTQHQKGPDLGWKTYFMLVKTNHSGMCLSLQVCPWVKYLILHIKGSGLCLIQPVDGKMPLHVFQYLVFLVFIIVSQLFQVIHMCWFKSSFIFSALSGLFNLKQKHKDNQMFKSALSEMKFGGPDSPLSGD